MSHAAGARLKLRLFVAGNAPNSRLALTHLERASAGRPPGSYDLEIIDVLEHPELALRHSILVTPTLVRLAPRPERRLVGNLSTLETLASLEDLA